MAVQAKADSTHPWFEGRKPEPYSYGGFVGVHYRVVVNIPMVANSDWLIVVLMNAMERVDWFCTKKKTEAFTVYSCVCV